MTSFDKREEGFERAFTLQEELRFKARARRNRRLGDWAAEQLGLSDQARQDYVAALVERQVGAPDDEALIAELAKALENVEPPISEHRIRRRLEKFEGEAAGEIQAGR
jgi:hypothetical protein